MTALAELNQPAADLIEICEKFAHVEEEVFWDTIRSLWAKQLVRLQVERSSAPLIPSS